MHHTLNPPQQEAATHIDGPLLVLAGAGSGKTRVVTYRIAQLISLGIPPSQILAVTFTNKAAGEMQERISKLLTPSHSFSRPLIATFHSLGARILRESIHHLGYSANFTIYDEEDSNKLLKGCFETLSVQKEVPLFRSLISQAKNQLLSPSELDTSSLSPSLQKNFATIYSTYQTRLKEANAVDFDDLLFLTVRLFQTHPDVLAAYQERWKYLLIDEYQDTNRAQYLMARYLVEKTHNIFAVGDPDQSIYSWRGANIQNILNFEKDYPGARTIELTQNYRSRKNILDSANALIQNNASRFEKNLWSDRGPGEKISLFVGESEREEAGFVISEIERLQQKYKVSLNEIVIFYRTNFQSRIFEDYLLRRRIPYVIVGGISFYQRKEIKDILAFLRMVVSDYDIVSFERTIHLPKRGVGTATLEKIREKAQEKQTPILEYCFQLVAEKGEEQPKLSAKQREGLQEYAQLIRSLRKIAESGSLLELVSQTVEKSGYYNILLEDKETFEDRKGNVEELIGKAHEWELLNEGGTLEKFLEELSLRSSLDEARFSHEKVNLMTIHNGKGLEFDVAFLVGMEEDLFPHANSRNSHEAVEEERRLCYVGMTRAKERLYLSAAETRFIWGTQRMMRPSRFLREVPRELLQRIR